MFLRKLSKLVLLVFELLKPNFLLKINKTLLKLGGFLMLKPIHDKILQFFKNRCELQWKGILYMEMTEKRINTMRIVLRLGVIVSNYQETSLEMQMSDFDVCILNNIIESSRLTEEEISIFFNFLSNVEKTFKKLERK